MGGSSALAGCFGGDGGGASPTTAADPSPTAGDPSPTTVGTESPSATEMPTQMGQAGPSDEVVVVSPEGDINQTLSEVAPGVQSGAPARGTVRLQTGKDYQISEPIEMPYGTVLDCNGAKLIPTGNHDVVHMTAANSLLRPLVDARDTDGWDSTIVTVTTRAKKVEPRDPVYISEMLLFLPGHNGTGIKLTDTNGLGFWGVDMTGVIEGGETGLHLRTEGEASWVNTCFFRGVMRFVKTCVLMESEPDRRPVNGHRFQIVMSPEETEWFWDLQSGDRNRILGTLWDVTRDGEYVIDETVWRIGETAGGNNVLVDEHGTYNWEDQVVEQAIGGAPNGAKGNTLFNWSEAHAHLDMRRKIENYGSRLDELESQINGG